MGVTGRKYELVAHSASLKVHAGMSIVYGSAKSSCTEDTRAKGRDSLAVGLLWNQLTACCSPTEAPSSRQMPSLLHRDSHPRSTPTPSSH